MKILLVDDHEVVRIGLKTIIERREGFKVIGEAEGAADGLRLTLELKPDVVIMDIRMPGGSGIEACREIRQQQPETKVVMLTSYADDEAVVASIIAGATGYVLKQIGSTGILDALNAISRGEALLDPQVTIPIFKKIRDLSYGETRIREAKLTEQENKILLEISKGKTNKEIATTLYLSEKTVRNYVSSILRKLGLSNRSQAVALVVRRD